MRVKTSARRGLKFSRGGILHATVGIVLALMPAHGFAQQFGSGSQIEFHFDTCGITLNRFEADVQVLSDLPRVVAAPQQLKYFQFTVAQMLDGRSCLMGFSGNK